MTDVNISTNKFFPELPDHGHWPEYRGTRVDAQRFDQFTRQQKRAISRHVHLQDLRQRFGGRTDRGGSYWPPEMCRSIARSIARDQSKTNWRNV